MALTPEQIRNQLAPHKTEHKSQPEPASAPTPAPLRALPAPKVAQDRQVSRPTRPRGSQAVVPQAPQIELAAIAALYQFPAETFPVFNERGRREFFDNPVYRHFLDLMADYLGVHFHLDPTSFLQSLIDSGELKKVGGMTIISEILGSISPPEAFDYHLDILRDKYVARETARLGQVLAAQVASADEEEIWTFIANHERALHDLRALATDKLQGVENFAYSDLLAFDAKADPTVLLGAHRWLGQGYTCLWAGGSGYGKSTLEMQAALYWAAGAPLFGIKPIRPLKSLIIQAENDLGDTGEQFQGVIAGIQATGDITLNGAVERMIIVNRLIGCTGDSFLGRLRSLLKLHRPDLVWIDPLFAFAGCDLIDTASVSKFLREGLIPIAVEHQVCAHVIHHVSKPARENDAKKDWTGFDYQYLGFGSSEIQNAFRAVNILIPVSGEEGTFRLILSKRGARAGALDTEGEVTTSLYLCHAKGGGILWSQVDKPEEKEKRGGGGGRVSAYKLETLLDQMSIVHGLKTTDLHKHVCDETGMSRRTFYRLFEDAKSTGKIKLDSDNKWTLVPRETNT